MTVLRFAPKNEMTTRQFVPRRDRKNDATKSRCARRFILQLREMNNRDKSRRAAAKNRAMKRRRNETSQNTSLRNSAMSLVRLLRQKAKTDLRLRQRNQMENRRRTIGDNP